MPFRSSIAHPETDTFDVKYRSIGLKDMPDSGSKQGEICPRKVKECPVVPKVPVHLGFGQFFAVLSLCDIPAQSGGLQNVPGNW